VQSVIPGRHARARQEGFTLIELLVVMGILVVLAAILFPVVLKGKDRAVRTSCLSNVRQLAAATMMYAGDHDNVMPYQGKWSDEFGWWAPPGPGRMPVLLGLKPYVESVAVFHCPSDVTRIVEIVEGGQNQENSARGSYDYIGAWVHHLPNPQRLVETYVSDFDGHDLGLSDFPMWWDLNGGYRGPSLILSPGSVNHWPDGGNVAYLDGHACWFPAERWEPGDFPVGVVPRGFVPPT
jgi:prepilin-type N-terminal cleavage/methylation domain-containing protein/prepilin-type processing-associated H-X9-DG protein